MTEIRSAGSSRTRNWPLIGLLSVNVAVVLASWLIAYGLAPDLPDHWQEANLFWPWYATLSLGFVLLAARAGRNRRQPMQLEDALALGLGMAGLGLTGNVISVALNLGATSVVPMFDSPAALAVLACGAFASFAAGRWFAALAGIRRLRHEAVSGRRVAWIGQVRADAAWRLVNAVVVGVVALACIALVLAVPQPVPWLLVAYIGAMWLIAVAASAGAWVSVSSSGIRVSGRSFLGWALPLSEVARARVVEVNLRMMIEPHWPATVRCLIRRGPALEASSTSGRAYLVSLPNAEEAVAVLDRLLAERRAKDQ